VVVVSVLVLVMVTVLFLAVMIVLGSKPKKLYWASFWGPWMDSRRYVVGYFWWSFEYISMG
jgi:hypothetical protein